MIDTDQPSGDQLERLIDATNALTQVANRSPSSQSVSTTSGVHLHGENLVAIVVAAIGAICAVLAATAVVVALASVMVIWGWREADMRDLSRVRSDVRELQAYRVQHGERITTLEAANVDTQPK